MRKCGRSGRCVGLELCLHLRPFHSQGCFWFHICSICDSCHTFHTFHTLHRQFTDSVAALHGKDAARVGADPAGSRVLEALLEGSAPPKVRKGVGDMGESVECVENRGKGAPHSACSAVSETLEEAGCKESSISCCCLTALLFATTTESKRLCPCWPFHAAGQGTADGEPEGKLRQGGHDRCWKLCCGALLQLGGEARGVESMTPWVGLCNVWKAYLICIAPWMLIWRWKAGMVQDHNLLSHLLCNLHPLVSDLVPHPHTSLPHFHTCLQDADVKEAIAGELVGAQKELQGTHWGPSLLKRVGAEAFARDPEQWR